MDSARQTALHEQLYPITEADKFKKNARKLDKERELGDIQALLKLPEGRRFFWGMIFNEAAVFRTAMTGDRMTTDFNLGRQDVGLLLLQKINNADHNAFARMQSEYFSKLKSEESQIGRLEKTQKGGA